MRKAVLKVRYFLGWGHEPEELRTLGNLALSGSMYTAFMAIVAPLGLGVFAYFESRGHRVASAVVAVVPLCAAMLVLAALLATLSIYYRRLAGRATISGIGTFYGHCFEVIPDAPLRLFARLGLTSETARWFRLPVEWDTVVVASSDQFEITASVVTGYVTRLRRVSPYPITLSAEAPLEMQAAPAGRATRATPEIRRYMRSVWWRGKGAAPRLIVWSGICMLFGGAVFGGIYGLIFLLPLIAPETTWAEVLQTAAVLSWALLLSIGLVIWGIALLCSGLRGRRDHNTQADIEGMVVAAHEHQDLFTASGKKSIFVVVEAPGDRRKVLRIPTELAHRVPPGACVRIEYQPVSEHVVSVTRLDLVPGIVSSQG